MHKIKLLRGCTYLLLLQQGLAYADISGKVFTDFNLNGVLDSTGSIQNFAKNMSINTALDQGLSGVSVQASCVTSSGSTNFSAVTDAQGVFTIATPNTVEGSQNCLLKLSSLPEGYSVGSQSTSDANVLTQFVSPNASNVQFAVKQTLSYCQNNPDLATSRFAHGQQTPNPPYAGNNDVPNIFAFPYNSGAKGQPQTQPAGWNEPQLDNQDPAIQNLALAQQVGSIFGLGWHGASKSLFAAAYMKAWTGFGTGGTGAIYRIDMTDPNTPNTSLYADLNAIFPATPPITGADPYLTGIFSPANPGYVQIADGSDSTKTKGAYITSGDTERDNQMGQIGNAVSKTAFGDLDVSSDGKSIFVINLANQQLYILPLKNTSLSPADASFIKSYPIPVASNCKINDGMFPPGAFGLGEYQGDIYVGTRCDTGWAQPQFSVFRFSTKTQQFDTAPNLSYLSTKDVYSIFKMQLTDITFDFMGNMTLAYRAFSADNGETNDHYGVVRRACLQDAITHTWSMENNGNCGSITTAGKDSAQGPNGGDYFFQEWPADQGAGYHQASFGGLAQIPGFLESAYTVVDPFQVYTAGVAWLDMGLGDLATAGQRNRAYSLYFGRGSTVDNRPINGKNGALGDLEVLCDAPPVEIGNRVWQDTNSNGVQDAGEAPIAGVKVELFAEKVDLDTATPLATAITDAQGYYLFSNDMRGYPATGNSAPNDISGANGGFDTADIQGGRASSNSQKFGLSALQTNTNYQVVIRQAEGASQQAPLKSLVLTSAKQGTDTERDSDASLLTNQAISQVTTSSDSNNHSVDFGFKALIPIDLELSKSVSQPNVVLGETFSYTLTLTNNSATTATAIQVKDALPNGLSLVKATPVLGTFNNGLWEIPSLGANASTTLTLDVTVSNKPAPPAVP